MLTGEHGIGFHACRRARLIWGASVRAYALCAVRVASRWRGLGSGSGQLALWERAVRASRCGSIYRSSAHRCRLCIVLCMCTRQDAKTTASGRSVPKSLSASAKRKAAKSPAPPRTPGGPSDILNFQFDENGRALLSTIKPQTHSDITMRQCGPFSRQHDGGRAGGGHVTRNTQRSHAHTQPHVSTATQTSLAPHCPHGRTQLLARACLAARPSPSCSTRWPRAASVNS